MIKLTTIVEMIFGQKQKRLTSLENKFKEKYPIESLRIFLMLDGSIHLDSIRYQTQLDL